MKLSKWKKAKIRISYFLILLAMVVYVYSKSTSYQQYMEAQDYETKISEVQKELDNIMVKINTKNSKQEVYDANPDLSVHDNVYYLEKNE